MTLVGRQGSTSFRSGGGGGRWHRCDQANSTDVGKKQSLKVPFNMAAELLTKEWKGLVPCIGIRVKGSIVADVNAGSPDLNVTKLQLGSFVDATIRNPFKQAYSQTPLDLANFHFISQIVNARVANLDRDRFYDDDETLCAPKAGLDPVGIVSPDTSTGTPAFKFMGGLNGKHHPALDITDSYWRALEDPTPIRRAGATTTSFDNLYAIPLCADTGLPMQDSIPLPTMCDPTRQWSVDVKVNRAFEGAIVHAADGGSVTISEISLYVYVIRVRKSDAYRHGKPYQIRQTVRAESPLQYRDGEVILFTGNLPDTQSTLADTVDGRAYQQVIAYGSYNDDFTQGNAATWYVGNQTFWPPHPLHRSPREVYEAMWNIDSTRPGGARPRLRTGLATDVCAIAGRDLNAVLGYQNRISDQFDTHLGAVSSCPIRVMACTVLTNDAFTGFGSLEKGCGVPKIEVEGTWNFSSTDRLSGINQMTDIVINNDTSDDALIKDLGEGCCTSGRVKWNPVIDNPDSPKGKLLAGVVTGFAEDVKFAPAMAAAQAVADAEKKG